MPLCLPVGVQYCLPFVDSTSFRELEAAVLLSVLRTEGFFIYIYIYIFHSIFLKKESSLERLFHSNLLRKRYLA